MLIAAALITAVIAQAAAPSATTGAADTIATTSATVTGTVNPNATATTYHVDYGTTATYGLSTPDQDAGNGTSNVSVRVPLSGLTSDTTYHYRLVAKNADGVTTNGADRSFRTIAAPRAPSASVRAARDIGPLSATVSAAVTPHNLPTTVRFEYGTSTSYGTATPDQAIGAGNSAVVVSATLSGLRPNTRYHFRAVATNAAGVARSGDRSFTTLRAPTGVAITPAILRPVWGSGLQVTGAVSGVGSVPVALERQPFPYSGPYTEIATVTANSSGGFSFTVPPLFVTTRLRAVTRTGVVVMSPPTTISVAVKVGVKSRRAAHRRVRLEGTTWPAVPNGRISLQRRTRAGRWGPIAHAKPGRLSGDRSRYRFTLKGGKRRTAFRVVVVARDGGAHVPGVSRIVKLRVR